MKPESIDLKRMRYSEPKQNASGGRTIYISYLSDDGNEQRMYWQTGEMYIPWGMSSWDNGKHTIDLSWPKDGSHDSFHSKLTQLEEKVVADALANSPDWLKKKYKSNQINVVREFFSPVIRKSKDKETGEPDGKYSDTLKVKIYQNRDGKWTAEVYDNNKEQVDLSEALSVRGTKVKCLLHLASVWVAGNSFGLTWVLHQAKITEAGSSQGLRKGYNFVESDSDDDDNDEDEEEEESD